MIPSAQITRRAARDGVPARAVERDYVISHLVAGLAKFDDSHVLFKGGTALRLCFFDDYRYSADLDFSVVEMPLPDAYGIVRDVLQMVASDVGLPILTLDDGTPPRIRFVGPLGRERWIKVDLADDELVLQARKVGVRPLWPDVATDVEIHAYTLVEITGEKLRCVLQRLQCRDLFDLHEIFERGGVDAEEATPIFRAKASHRGFDPDEFAARFEARLAQYARRWESELQEHIGDPVPEFDGVVRRVRRHLRQGGLL